MDTRQPACYTPTVTLPSWFSRALGLVALAALAGCGSAPKPAPGPRDIARVGSSLGDIVFQCQSVAAGYVAGADRAALKRDVDALVAAFDRVSPDAGYSVGTAPGPTRRTTVRRELRLARRALSTCEPRLAKPLDVADGH
jgi:hypothetical protein